MEALTTSRFLPRIIVNRSTTMQRVAYMPVAMAAIISWTP